jgi:hypothetical protein
MRSHESLLSRKRPRNLTEGTNGSVLLFRKRVVWGYKPHKHAKYTHWVLAVEKENLSPEPSVTDDLQQPVAGIRWCQLPRNCRKWWCQHTAVVPKVWGAPSWRGTRDPQGGRKRCVGKQIERNVHLAIFSELYLPCIYHPVVITNFITLWISFN